MAVFGLISEGITDHIVIEYILYGWFNNGDIPITYLQPLDIKSQKEKGSVHGGWVNVLKYCESSDFQEAVQSIDYIVVQIDADIFRSENLPESYKVTIPIGAPVEETYTLIKNKLIEIIGDAFYQDYKEKIIFAISIDSIECWLLPIYYASEPTKAAKTVNCLASLNQKLSAKHKFTIDSAHKNPDYYKVIAKTYSKQREIRRYYQLNPTLRIFVEEIENRGININELMED